MSEAGILVFLGICFGLFFGRMAFAGGKRCRHACDLCMWEKQKAGLPRPFATNAELSQDQSKGQVGAEAIITEVRPR